MFSWNITIDYHWLSLVIIDYHWLLLIIINYHWLSLTIIDYHLLPEKGESLTDWLSGNLKSRDASASKSIKFSNHLSFTPKITNHLLDIFQEYTPLEVEPTNVLNSIWQLKPMKTNVWCHIWLCNLEWIYVKFGICSESAIE